MIEQISEEEKPTDPAPEAKQTLFKIPIEKGAIDKNSPPFKYLCDYWHPVRNWMAITLLDGRGWPMNRQFFKRDHTPNRRHFYFLPLALQVEDVIECATDKIGDDREMDRIFAKVIEIRKDELTVEWMR